MTKTIAHLGTITIGKAIAQVILKVMLRLNFGKLAQACKEAIQHKKSGYSKKTIR